MLQEISVKTPAYAIFRVMAASRLTICDDVSSCQIILEAYRIVMVAAVH
jgi:hypothetical protein